MLWRRSVDLLAPGLQRIDGRRSIGKGGMESDGRGHCRSGLEDRRGQRALGPGSDLQPDQAPRRLRGPIDGAEDPEQAAAPVEWRKGRPRRARRRDVDRQPAHPRILPKATSGPSTSRQVLSWGFIPVDVMVAIDHFSRKAGLRASSVWSKHAVHRRQSATGIQEGGTTETSHLGPRQRIR